MVEIQDQPPPVNNDSRPIWELVIEDMKTRDQVGRQRYGTPLQAFNGRDGLVDAYQEALDLCVYMRQLIEEREWLKKRPPSVDATGPLDASATSQRPSQFGSVKGAVEPRSTPS